MSAGADWKEFEQRIRSVVKAGRRPVAVAFLDAPPSGVTKFAGIEPSGCSFWRLAADGRTFYTAPENHFNCAVDRIRTTFRFRLNARKKPQRP